MKIALQYWLFGFILLQGFGAFAMGPAALTFKPASSSSSQISLINQSLEIRPGAANYNELIDYLVQDVCVDSHDLPVSGDPVKCAIHRNIKIGEKVPYISTDIDHGNGNMSYQGMFSYPVLGADGNLKVLAAKNLQGNFSSTFKFSFQLQRDGYDLLDLSNSNFASFIRTSDGGCYDQIFSRDGRDSSLVDRAGGWLLFPLNESPSSFAQTNSTGNVTYNFPISPNRPSHCVAGNSSGITYWNKPASYQFETGKVMNAIRSDHFASGKMSNSNNALERYYFTKEYGFTRWEAWIPQSRCFSDYGSSNPICHPEQANYLSGRCSVMNVSSTGIPGLDIWGNQKWVRVDCRDETNLIQLSEPLIPLNSTMAQDDGFDDINSAAVFAAGANAP